jgi:hypothetical protein
LVFPGRSASLRAGLRRKEGLFQDSFHGPKGPFFHQKARTSKLDILPQKTLAFDLYSCYKMTGLHDLWAPEIPS